MKIYYNKKKGDFKITVYPRKFLEKFYDEREFKSIEYSLSENHTKKTITITFKKKKVKKR